MIISSTNHSTINRNVRLITTHFLQRWKTHNGSKIVMNNNNNMMMMMMRSTSQFHTVTKPITIRLGSQYNIQPSSSLSSSLFLSRQKRSMFIQTSTTPNPESLKFIPGRPVLGEGSNNNETTNGFYVTKNEKDEITKSPLCINLFKDVEGIKGMSVIE